MKRVLIIEDEQDIVDLLTIHLKDLNCTVNFANQGESGLAMASQHEYHLIILDLMLPNMNGLTVCQKLRAQDNYTPILMLTAKSEEFDKVLGLESGADDYMTKPFGIRELIARVNAIFRRWDQAEQMSKSTTAKMCFGNLEIDVNRRKVSVNNNRIELTPKEFDLLLLMARNPGKSYSRHELLDQVWGYQFSGYEHTVNSHINRLRAKIEPNADEPIYILTTWGVGYRFNDELKAD
jgi:two-component system, OmpR family, alkaline phosphatase synthesis response regulator PhoP